jgi:F0F1-type ATP synthase assembly protein I
VSPDNQDNKGDKGDWQRAMREASPFLGIGGTIAGCLAIGLVGGRWLDGKLGTWPWCFLAGAVLGLTAGFVQLYMTVARSKK